MIKYFLYVSFIISIVLSVGCSKEKVFLRLVDYSGTVFSNNKKIDISTQINYNDIITLGDNGFADITLNDNNILRLNDDVEYMFNQDEKYYNIKLKSGSMLGIFEKNGLNGLRVVTNTIRFPVNNAVFFLKILENMSVYLCVCHGKLDIFDANNNLLKTLNSNHHEAYIISFADERVVFNDNQKIKWHNDKIINELYKKIKLHSDWTVK